MLSTLVLVLLCIQSALVAAVPVDVQSRAATGRVGPVVWVIYIALLLTISKGIFFAPGLGSCGFTDKGSDSVVALAISVMKGGKSCNKVSPRISLQHSTPRLPSRRRKFASPLVAVQQSVLHATPVLIAPPPTSVRLFLPSILPLTSSKFHLRSDLDCQ
jgi:hypothetical protein